MLFRQMFDRVSCVDDWADAARGAARRFIFRLAQKIKLEDVAIINNPHLPDPAQRETVLALNPAWQSC